MGRLWILDVFRRWRAARAALRLHVVHTAPRPARVGLSGGANLSIVGGRAVCDLTLATNGTTDDGTGASMATRDAAPPIQFDGRFHWYTERHDPDDDRCSLCQGPIAEEEVPLILFTAVKDATWQARFCEACTPNAFALLRRRP
jgi:hypothetical protein